MSKREVSFQVGVVVERRPAKSRWIDWVWRPLAALDGTPKTEPFTRLSEEPDGTASYYVGAKTVTLWPRETDAYLLNLAANPSLYVVLRPRGVGEVPYNAHLVTASPYEAELYTTSGDEIMEAVPMPAPIREIIEAFCETYPYQDHFEKRPRKKGRKQEKMLFGKEPIFKQPGHMPERGGDGGE